MYVKNIISFLKNKFMLTTERFSSLTNIVIDNFEGGYYHPNMKARFSQKAQQIFGDSGETMFGLDRKHGSQLAGYEGWKEFWAILDKEGAAAKWKHKYIPGDPLKTELRTLTSKIMYQWFNKLGSLYLTADSLQAIENDDRLVIHFSYASWNGQGWFQRYANALNAAIRKFTDKETIFLETIKARTNSSNEVIRQQGVNMMNLFAKLHL
jgi:hypothetical protein